MGIAGLWLGMCIAEVILDIGVSIIIFTAKWNLEGKGPSTTHEEICDGEDHKDCVHQAPEFTLKEQFVPGESKMTQL